jgi:hypothetical protein
MRWILSDVIINSYYSHGGDGDVIPTEEFQISGDPQGSGVSPKVSPKGSIPYFEVQRTWSSVRPTETVTLNYSKIEFKYNYQEDEEEIGYSWDLKEEQDA